MSGAPANDDPARQARADRGSLLRRFGLDGLGLALSVIYALPALLYPHGNDQAVHWYVGQGLLQGELPYATAISGKPIGIFLVHALSSVIFGPGQMAIRLMEIPTLIACAWLITRLLRPVGTPRRDGEWGVAAILLSGLYYTFFDYWDTAHPELWEVTLILWAAHVALHEPRHTRRALLCGALGGAAFMVKYPAAIIALPVAILCGLRAMADCRSWPQRAIAVTRAAGLYLAGVAAVFLLCVLPFAVTNTLQPMWEILVTLLIRYAGQAPGVPVGPAWIGMSHGGATPIVAGVCVLLGLGLALRRADRDALERGGFVLTLGVAAFASVALQGRYFPYHYVVAAPLMAACMAFGLRLLLPNRTAVALGVSVAAVAIAFFAEPRWCTHPKMSYRVHTDRALRYMDGQISRTVFLTAFAGNNYLDHYADHEHIGLEIRKRARPGDALCVRGFAPAIYQVAGLRCPSRLVMQPFPAGLPRWEIEFQRVLHRARPRFVVSFDDRKRELRILSRLGYRKTPMPTLYALLEHMPERNAKPARRRPRPATPRERPAKGGKAGAGP